MEPPVREFNRPNVEGPPVLWEYTTKLERWVINAEERMARLRTTLERIAAHPVISESALADDNCDWHCTLTIVGEAKDALAEVLR